MNLRLAFVLLACVSAAIFVHAAPVADRQQAQRPDRVHLNGWLGQRIAANASNRLVRVDTDRLLEGYRQRPGRQTWDGEHVGKWMHAATLAWVNNGDPALRAKLDATAAELAKCQLEDGYLGTYLDAKRWTDWDVWSHKYNLIGLQTYLRYTGTTNQLAACTRMADLLCRTFGDEPGQRDILKAGHHAGMAPTSVLEPMVWLYRTTSEPRYLDFCRYILRSWERPEGPQIVSRLIDGKRVDKVGNAKAYEMLSCLNGLLEYHRLTGEDPQHLQACLNAWQDIVEKRLYLTGTASSREHFHDDFELPNNDNVGETCVTVTWLQFNAHLLRLTGESRFAEQLERTVLNQLLGAQKPDGTGWGYYVQMEGRKPYSSTLDGHCCLSSGPRGLAIVPTFAITADADGAVFNLYDAGTARIALPTGEVRFVVNTAYPFEPQVRMEVNPDQTREFAIKLRRPAWCDGFAVRVNGEPVEARAGADGYVAIRRTWEGGDRIAIDLPLPTRVIAGTHGNTGKAAVMFGPLVLAADDALFRAAGRPFGSAAIPVGLSASQQQPAPAVLGTTPGSRVFTLDLVNRRGGAAVRIPFATFADAGASGARYQVWNWTPNAAPTSSNLLTGIAERASRQGNRPDSFADDDARTHAVTFNGRAAAEDWYEIEFAAPELIARVVFQHGHAYHDGGWFDASAGKLRIQIRATASAEWETVGELTGYPATTATDSAGLQDGQAFDFRPEKPVRAAAIRVVGRPATGDDAKQAFSSCAELQAFSP